MKGIMSKINISASDILKILIIIIFTLTPFTAFSQEENETVKTVGTVLINPGHGGRDLGLLVEEKIKEKDITLGIARKISALNTDNSAYSFILSRKTDVTRSDDERISMVDELRPSAYLSLHVGASFDPVVRGIKIYTWSNIMGTVSSGRLESEGKWWKKTDNNILKNYKIRLLEDAQSDYVETSKELAESIRDEIIKIRGIPCTIESAPVMELGSITAPSVSIEIFQSSNETDRKMILDENVMAEIAGALFRGAENFASEQNSIER